jgi:ligand-binding sensor domain-containing protein
LWIGNFRGLSYYDRKTDKLKFVQVHKNGTYTNPFYIDDKERVWHFAAYPWGVHIYDPKHHTVQLVTNEANNKMFVRPAPFYKPVREFWSQCDNGIQKNTIQHDKVVKVERFFDGSNSKFPAAIIYDRLLVENDSSFWLGSNKGLIHFNPITLQFQIHNISQYPKESFTFSTLYQNRYLYTGTTTHGLWVFDVKTNQFIEHYSLDLTNSGGLSGNSIDKVLIDKDQNLFVSVVKRGLAYTKLNRPKMYHFLSKQNAYSNNIIDNEITSITDKGTEIWCGIVNGGIVVLGQDGKILKQFKTDNLAGPRLGSNNVQCLYTDSQQRQWIGTASGLILYENNKTKQLKSTEEIGEVYHMLETEPRQYVVSTMLGVYFVTENKKGLFEFQKFILKDYPNLINNGVIWQDKTRKRLYVATESGGTPMLFIKKNNQWIYENRATYNNIRSITSYLDTDSLLLGTRDGLYVVGCLSLQGRHIEMNQKELFKDISAIYRINATQYWIVGDNGMIRYDFATKLYEKFGEGEGLASTEINYRACLKLTNGKILIGGSNGLNVIDSELKKDNFKIPPIFLSDFKLNDLPNDLSQGINQLSEVIVQPQHATFSFKITTLDFSQPYNYKIQYQLINYDSQWITASNPATIRYTNLPADKYTFQVRLLLDNGIVSEVQKKITIEIVPPIWKTWWFRALLVAIIGGIVYALSRNKILKERKEAQLNQQRAEAETKALRAQMNPHFVFNCMNTIEYYMVTHQTDKASAFLQNFSLLIRNVLENSQKELITIEEELDTLDLYIDLEIERADNQFDYEFINKNGIQLNDYQIPPLLLQPFVENAILHGLRHKTDGKGLLKINTKIENNKLIINIVDNGIGRIEAAKINNQNSRKSKSVGLEVTFGRIKALETIYNSSTNCIISDLEPFGTSVELVLPILNTKYV